MTQEPESTSKPITLLLVDDEQNILSSLRRLFRPLGYEILMAKNGREGLEVLENEVVDLVISDMRMPEMDGAEFLEQAALRWPDTMRILLTGHADLNSAVSAINRGNIYKYINKPWEDNDLKLTVQHALEKRFLEQERRRLVELTQRQNAELKDLNANLENKVRERTAQLQETHNKLKTTHETLKKNYLSSIKVFASLIELREGVRRGHARRIADQGRNLAIEMGMSPTEAQDVMIAGLLHDLGKITLADNLLNAPFYSLSHEERALVAAHPVVGETVLMGLEPLREAARLIRSHHERWDGQGYPDALKGEQIPLGARILAVVNDYDDLQTGALWTQTLSAVEAREFLEKNRSKRYDPKVVDALFREFVAQPTRVNEKQAGLRPGALREGMILARDVFLADGIMLLSEGHVLDDRMIDRLRNFEKMSGQMTIYVYESEETGANTGG